MASLSHYLSSPESLRIEIVDGKLHDAACPSPRHQRICGRLFTLLQEHLVKPHSGELFFAPMAVILDETNIVEPDLVYIASANSGRIETIGFRGIPDLVVEVLSPSTRGYDIGTKLELFQRFGIPAIWLIDPESNEASLVEKNRAGTWDKLVQSSDSLITSRLFPQLQFGWDQVFNPSSPAVL